MTKHLIIGPKSFEKCFQHLGASWYALVKLSIRGDAGWRNALLSGEYQLAAISHVLCQVIIPQAQACDPNVLP
jgi:hypothetical protein